MEVDFRGSVNNVKIGAGDGINTLLEAVVNSIQSCNCSSGDHTISIELLSEIKTIDGKDSSYVNGFRISDDGVGFNDDNYTSFRRIGSTLKLDLGCKGIGRLTWLKVFSDVSVDSVFLSDGKKYRRTFSFTLEGDGVVGGDEPVPVDDSTKVETVITVRHCKAEYAKGLRLTTYRVSSLIADHCISFFLDGGTVPTIMVIQNDDRDVVNEIWESTKHNVVKDSVTCKGFGFDIVHVKFYKNYSDKGGISLCANGLEVESHPNEFNYGLMERDGTKFRYKCFVYGSLLDSTVNSSRDGFTIGSKHRTIEEFDKPTTEEILDAIRPLCTDYLKEYSGEYYSRCRDRLDRFLDTDVGKTFSAIVTTDPDLPLLIKPEDDDVSIFNTLSERKTKINSELIFAPSIDRNPKVKDRKAIEKRLSQIRSSQKDDLAMLFVHRGLILSAFDDRLEVIRRCHPNGDEVYRMELESVIHDLILPRGTDMKNQPVLSSSNLWILDERLNTYTFQGAYSDKKLCQISDSDSELRPDVFIFGDIDDDMSANSICIIEFKRPNRKDTNVIDQIFGYVTAISKARIENYRHEKISPKKETIYYCYSVCDTTSEEFEELARFRQLKPLFAKRGYYMWNSDMNSSLEIYDHHRLFSDAKLRNRLFFKMIGMDVGSDQVKVSVDEDDVITIDNNDRDSTSFID